MALSLRSRPPPGATAALIDDVGWLEKAVTYPLVTIHDVAIDALTGGPADLHQYRGRTMLIVNVASKCGLTPQYASLQKLYETYADRGLVVVGVPCNQFGGQEPGTSLEIADFCEVNFGITFPLTAKVDVNGPERHQLFEHLSETADPDGTAGDIRWNFEKFLVAPEGDVVARFRPLTDPLSPELVAAVEENLPDDAPAPSPVTPPAAAAPVVVAPPVAPVVVAPVAPVVAAPIAAPTPAAPEPSSNRGLLSRFIQRRDIKRRDGR
jgi:glutathione peroxidase